MTYYCFFFRRSVFCIFSNFLMKQSLLMLVFSHTKCSSFSSLTMSKGGRGPLSEHLLVLFPVLLQFINSSFENTALHSVDKTCWTSLASRCETNSKRFSCWLEPPDSSATTLSSSFLIFLLSARISSLILIGKGNNYFEQGKVTKSQSCHMRLIEAIPTDLQLDFKIIADPNMATLMKKICLV